MGDLDIDLRRYIQFGHHLFLLNAFIAIIVDEYEAARISCGYEPKEYKWKEYDYGKWCFWIKCACLPLSPQNGYFWFRKQDFWNTLGDLKVKNIRVCKCLGFLKPIEIPDEEDGSDEED